jgi:hypothetical protein
MSNLKKNPSKGYQEVKNVQMLTDTKIMFVKKKNNSNYG